MIKLNKNNWKQIIAVDDRAGGRGVPITAKKRNHTILRQTNHYKNQHNNNNKSSVALKSSGYVYVN